MNHRGFITLVSVIIATVVAVAIVIGILGVGISSGKIGDIAVSGAHARAYANACAEMALEVIREAGAGTADASDDTGTGSLNFTVVDDGAEGSCSYSITDGGGENRTIGATGNAGDFTRYVQVVVDDIDTTINIDTWQEVTSI